VTEVTGLRQPPPGALARRIDHLCRLNTSGVRAGARGVASALQATRSSKLGRDTHTPLHRFRVGVRLCADTQTDMLPGEPGGAICVQSFDDSLNSAIRTTYRISLRSSSLREPRYPLLEVVMAIRMRGREAAHNDSRMWGLGVVKAPELALEKSGQNVVRKVGIGYSGNDPSAGSPTETLLRLLLPLNDKVCATSRSVAAGGPAASPQSEELTGPFNR
jgi:hypothetical protein